MKPQSLTKINPHEYALLDEIARDSMVTQASLSTRMGIAVGSVNWYVKRLIHRGWIKVSHLDRTRLQYDLTSEGMKVFTQRAMNYARDSLKVYDGLREKAKILATDLKQSGVKRVYLHGNDQLMDILRLTCMEAGLEISDFPIECVLEADGRDYHVRETGVDQ